MERKRGPIHAQGLEKKAPGQLGAGEQSVAYSIERHIILLGYASTSSLIFRGLSNMLDNEAVDSRSSSLQLRSWYRRSGF